MPWGKNQTPEKTLQAVNYNRNIRNATLWVLASVEQIYNFVSGFGEGDCRWIKEKHELRR